MVQYFRQAYLQPPTDTRSGRTTACAPLMPRHLEVRSRPTRKADSFVAHCLFPGKYGLTIREIGPCTRRWVHSEDSEWNNGEWCLYQCFNHLAQRPASGRLEASSCAQNISTCDLKVIIWWMSCYHFVFFLTEDQQSLPNPAGGSHGRMPGR